MQYNTKMFFSGRFGRTEFPGAVVCSGIHAIRGAYKFKVFSEQGSSESLIFQGIHHFGFYLVHSLLSHNSIKNSLFRIAMVEQELIGRMIGFA